MFNYAEMPTADLLSLLIQEEDRVTRQHIEELVRRGEEAAEPLRAILTNEDYWYEGQGGDYWMPFHAIAILSAIPDEKALPGLIDMLPHAYFSNHDWVFEILPASLAQFGEQAVEPLMGFIDQYRGAYRDNPDYSNCRHDCSAALTRIALENDVSRDRITSFVCGLFTNPEEDDKMFLSLSAAHPVALDGDRGVNALEAAYRRGAILTSIAGKFNDFIKSFDNSSSELLIDLETGLFDFYSPRAIEERRRERAAQKKEKLYWGADEVAVPTGYNVSQGGNLVRDEKVGRNDPCPCGSGKKYKKCCGASE